MSTAEYRKKLMDPRWQKKRLGILQRDEFKCVLCEDSESTLHVHHKHYNSCDPWDIHDSALVTLCEQCHEYETIMLADVSSRLLSLLRRCFSANELDLLFGELFNSCSPSDYGRHQANKSPLSWLKNDNEH